MKILGTGQSSPRLVASWSFKLWTAVSAVLGLMAIPELLQIGADTAEPAQQ